MGKVIRREVGRSGGRGALGWWLGGLLLIGVAGVLVAAWLRGGPVAMREIAVPLSGPVVGPVVRQAGAQAASGAEQVRR